MISVESQQKLLLAVSKRLKRKVIAYAIGGTAMMFLGFKDSTLDIDLVFEDEKDRKTFSNAITEIGYRKMDSALVYGEKLNHPEMFTLGDERFDLFVGQVIHFVFSRQMMVRAEDIHQFSDNLILKIADPHDLILMKCATDRQKDINDAQNIINSTKIDWNILINEAKNQILLGKHTASFDLGEFLEKLKYEMKVDIPLDVLDELFKIAKKQAEDKLNRVE